MTLQEIKDTLNTLAQLSECKDKKVAALAVLDGIPVAASWNVKDPHCDGTCNHTCCPEHAEHVLNAPRGSVVYLSLYPCEQCQRYLYNRGIAKVICFSEKHKEYLGLVPIGVVNDN